MTKLIDFLKGKKAYLLGLAGLAYAVSGYFTGHLDSKAALDAIWAALSVLALRAGISNAVQGKE
jgi:hypothetical protein